LSIADELVIIRAAGQGVRGHARGTGMKYWLNVMLGVLLAAVIVVPPVLRYRNLYSHQKRLREVTAGRFYRAGQLTANGLEDAVRRLGIRTVINVQDEFPDPSMDTSFWNRAQVSEVELCRTLGVRYEHIAPSIVPPRDAIAQFLKVMDDPTAYPVLLHCRAGLHRTGVLTAVYRMEYDGWSHRAAAAELKGHGFGDAQCTAANDYVKNFVLDYQPRRSNERAASE
jgi:protein tyrosine/serine phosphatase